jgi:L-amino acid N-acyltransferase YncA
MEEIGLRDATQADVPSICAIHNQGIEDRVATLDVDLHTPWTASSCGRR